MGLYINLTNIISSRIVRAIICGYFISFHCVNIHSKMGLQQTQHSFYFIIPLYNGCNGVNFTDTVTKYSLEVAESHPIRT